MKILSKEYDTNKLVDVTQDPELMKTILLFDRETSLVNMSHNKKYYMNLNYKDQEMIDLFNNNKVVMIIHQDSDRDIYIIKD